MTERHRVPSGRPDGAEVGFSRAVSVDDRIFVSGTSPIWPDGTVDPSVSAQSRRVFDIIGSALAGLGSGFHDVVRTRIFLTDAADMAEVARVHGEVFNAVRPATTAVIVAGLLDPRWKVEIEVEAIRS
jgi:enamine deaminase RidA (YjgF/YER057c/UK114 family)